MKLGFAVFLSGYADKLDFRRIWHSNICVFRSAQPNLRDYGCILKNQGSVYKRDESGFSRSTQPTGLMADRQLPVVFWEFFEDLVEEAVTLNIAFCALLTILLYQIRQRRLGGVVTRPTSVCWES